MVLPVHYGLNSQIQLLLNIYSNLQSLISILPFPNTQFKPASTIFSHGTQLNLFTTGILAVP